MTLHEDVIIDLLPLYFSGDASSQTRELIEAYFADHPGFAASMRAAHTNNRALIADGVGPAKASEVAAVEGVRKNLKWRSTCMGLAIFFSLAPFSFVKTNGQGAFYLLRDHPVQAMVMGAIGLAFWLMYFRLKRRTET